MGLEMSAPESKFITFDDYFDRLVAIQIQFKTAKRALRGFTDNPDTLKKYAEEELDDVRATIRRGAQEGSVVFEMWMHDEERAAKFLEGAKETAVRTLAEAGGRLAQYEYILTVTILESLLKDIHRAILTEAPRLLKEDRQIPLGKLVAKGGEEVLREEIEREVQMLDRKSVAEKAEYFSKRLGINWFGGTIVPIFEHVIRARNEMLHENPDRVVSEKDLLFSHLVVLSVPVATLAQAALLYPKAFVLPMHMAEDDARKFFLDAPQTSRS